MSRYVALSVESKLYSVCNRSLSLKSVLEGEVEYLLSISATECEMTFILNSLAFLPWRSIQLFNHEGKP